MAALGWVIALLTPLGGIAAMTMPGALGAYNSWRMRVLTARQTQASERSASAQELSALNTALRAENAHLADENERLSAQVVSLTAHVVARREAAATSERAAERAAERVRPLVDPSLAARTETLAERAGERAAQAGASRTTATGAPARAQSRLRPPRGVKVRAGTRAKGRR